MMVVNTRVMRGDRSKVYTIIMDPDLHKNLQRVSLAQDTNVSAIIRSASEQYLRNYLEQNKAGEVKACIK